ncbi:MAG: hypothetical protein ACI35V_03395 [Sphingobacterium composti]
MKRIYTSPTITVSILDIESSLCSTSSTIQVGSNDLDYQQEWEELDDDKRFIEW